MEIRDQLYVAILFVILCSSCVAQNGMEKPKCKYGLNTGYGIVYVEYTFYLIQAFLRQYLSIPTTC